MESQETPTLKGWLKKKWNEQEGENQEKPREERFKKWEWLTDKCT